jgi:hypothetical protein
MATTLHLHNLVLILLSGEVTENFRRSARTVYSYMKMPEGLRNKYFDIYSNGIKSCLSAVMNDMRNAAKTKYVTA